MTREIQSVTQGRQLTLFAGQNHQSPEFQQTIVQTGRVKSKVSQLKRFAFRCDQAAQKQLGSHQCPVNAMLIAFSIENVSSIIFSVTFPAISRRLDCLDLR
jgi:hypothetical protein